MACFRHLWWGCSRRALPASRRKRDPELAKATQTTVLRGGESLCCGLASLRSVGEALAAPGVTPSRESRAAGCHHPCRPWLRSPASADRIAADLTIASLACVRWLASSSAGRNAGARRSMSSESTSRKTDQSWGPGRDRTCDLGIKSPRCLGLIFGLNTKVGASSH
jgi:hypothetical protein